MKRQIAKGVSAQAPPRDDVNDAVRVYNVLFEEQRTYRSAVKHVLAYDATDAVVVADAIVRRDHVELGIVGVSYDKVVAFRMPNDDAARMSMLLESETPEELAARRARWEARRGH